MAKKTYDFEQLLNTVVTPFRKSEWRDDLQFMQHELESILEELDEETEAHSYLTELSELFAMLDWQTIGFSNVEKFRQWIRDLDWGNFECEEDDEQTEDGYYSLGSMFYNKLNWMIEGDEEESSEKVILFASKTIETLPAFLDALEQKFFYSTKKTKQ